MLRQSALEHARKLVEQSAHHGNAQFMDMLVY
jgi:hypothetical protein